MHITSVIARRRSHHRTIRHAFLPIFLTTREQSVLLTVMTSRLQITTLLWLVLQFRVIEEDWVYLFISGTCQHIVPSFNKSMITHNYIVFTYLIIPIFVLVENSHFIPSTNLSQFNTVIISQLQPDFSCILVIWFVKFDTEFFCVQNQVLIEPCVFFFMFFLSFGAK